MKVAITSDPLDKVNAQAIVIGVWKDQPLGESAREVDRLTDGRLTRLINSGDISADFLETSELLAVADVSASLILVIGLGKREDVRESHSYRVAGTAAKTIAAKTRKSVAFFLDEVTSVDAVVGAMVGCVGQDLYRKSKNSNPFEQIWWHTANQNQIDRGTILGEAANLTRQLVNEPGNFIYPETFTEHCIRTGAAAGFSVEVWDQEKLEQERCGALLAVAKGSEREPRLVIMRYIGGDDQGGIDTASFPIALVGKGVTFDSGGLSIKPSEFMFDMKMDMAGAATVLGAMQAIANLELPINVIGLVGLVENMISGSAFRLGDVLTARSGKTIEVHNTDAEGRLVLADLLDVALSYRPERLIDLATLTGACMIALGRNVAGLMSNNQAWCDEVLHAANQVGEQGWQLPMFNDFNQTIKSQVADIKNVGDGRYGGAITAAKFLEEFVADTPWVHIDIAGPAFAERPLAWIDAGASGCFVRTLVRVVENLTEK